MKKRISRSQKTASAIVALMLGAIITFTAVMNSFGITNDGEPKKDLMEIEILERAYADVMEDQFELVELEEVNIIKVYDEDNNLLREISVGENNIIEDVQVQSLVNRAEFLTELNNTSIYRISR